MPQGTRICKICGKEYSYCKTLKAPEMFRWQDVACCAKHGQEYLKRIIESRTPSKNTQSKNEFTDIAEEDIPTPTDVKKRSSKRDKIKTAE